VVVVIVVVVVGRIDGGVRKRVKEQKKRVDAKMASS
jgi:hypothetical protein